MSKLQTQHKLVADKRIVFGRKIRKLRREGVLPGNVYGKKIKSTPVQVDYKNFSKLYDTTGATGLVTLQLKEQELPVLIHDVHTDPVTGVYLHADFLNVDLTQKVTATVPLEFIGESPVEKSQEGIVVKQMNEVEVEALPADLPEQIDVDISSLLAVDDAITVADLKVDRSKVEIKEEDSTRIVVKIEPPAKEEVVEEVAPVVEGEEGAVPAEGEDGAPVEGGEVAPEGESKGEEKTEEEKASE